MQGENKAAADDNRPNVDAVLPPRVKEDLSLAGYPHPSRLAEFPEQGIAENVPKTRLLHCEAVGLIYRQSQYGRPELLAPRDKPAERYAFLAIDHTQAAGLLEGAVGGMGRPKRNRGRKHGLDLEAGDVEHGLLAQQVKEGDEVLHVHQRLGVNRLCARRKLVGAVSLAVGKDAAHTGVHGLDVADAQRGVLEPVHLKQIAFDPVRLAELALGHQSVHLGAQLRLFVRVQDVHPLQDLGLPRRDELVPREVDLHLSTRVRLPRLHSLLYHLGQLPHREPTAARGLLEQRHWRRVVVPFGERELRIEGCGSRYPNRLRAQSEGGHGGGTQVRAVQQAADGPDLRVQARGDAAQRLRGRRALLRGRVQAGDHGLHQRQVGQAVFKRRRHLVLHDRLGDKLVVARPVEVHEPLAHVVYGEGLEGLEGPCPLFCAAEEGGLAAHGLDQLRAVHVVHGLALERVVHGGCSPAVHKVRGEAIAHQVRDGEEPALGSGYVKRVAVVVVLAPASVSICE